MQVVESAEGVAGAIESAQRLARTAFGDDKLLLERYFRIARHVEVQVFADAADGVVTLFDRDCSIQRRHQKVVEEAPAPGIRPEVRAAMRDAAIKVARAVGYVGAGTIEFLMDAEQGFYFMEMNTRLQVEHPVTEMITGVDLVEWQLRVARGERLADFAAPLSVRGAAVEVRLYAEDPSHGYLPSVGRLQHVHWPAEGPHLRLDMGVDCGDEVSSFYDPMLGKVVAWSDTRAGAIEHLTRAVGEIEVIGVNTNRALLLSILKTRAFRDAQLATHFLESNQESLILADGAPDVEGLALMAIWCVVRQTDGNAAVSPWDDRHGWRIGGARLTQWSFDRGDVDLDAASGTHFSASVGAQQVSVEVLRRDAESLQVQLGARIVHARLRQAGAQLHLFYEGRHCSAHLVLTEDALESHESTDQGSLVTPLPGTVVAVHVKTGEAVKRGAALVTVEAMKMEHTLTAPRDGTVARVAYSVAERVSEGAVLIELSE
jgi:3-methylcrotonyl-CoA carboxylase alpha subunit